MYRRAMGIILASIALLLVSLCFDPRVLPADPGDRRYSKPHLENTIGYPALLFGVFGSFGLFSMAFHRYQDTSKEIKTMTGLGFVAALLLTSGVTENAKKVFGRLRPDFLARCRPDPSGACTGDPKKVTEGRKSFPSGHTSTAFCAILYIVYLVRVHSLNTVFFVAASAFFLVLGLSVGLSRILDNRHFLIDVVGGIAAGVLCTCMTVTLIHRSMKEQIAGTDYRL